MPSLFERLGGKGAVDVAVDKFYVKVLADPLLAPFFASTDMKKQAAHQKAFLTMAFGGPANYPGRAMREAHAALVKRGLTDKHFDAVVTHLAGTLKELGVKDADIAEVGKIAESVRKDVLGR